MSMKNNSQRQMHLPIKGVLYDPRFLESHAGKRILHDPRTAIVELIANAWDAGATQVSITWPDERNARFAIRDNGVGMTHEEFALRWRKLYYNRQDEQGSIVTFPDELKGREPQRIAFGRNGIGRWSGFCFGDEYVVDTSKGDRRNRYVVERGADTPFKITRRVKDQTTSQRGTTIECRRARQIVLSPEDARGEIGMRFLTNPNFAVLVNGHPVTFEDINDPNIETITLNLDDGNSVDLIVIDTQTTDRTTRQHGVAWHVGGRLVGTCSWRGAGADELIDGRRIAAKRFTFIVRADYLAEAEAIKTDWSGFDKDNDSFQKASQAVYEKVREYLIAASEDDRNQTLAKATSRNRRALQSIGPLEREKWSTFVSEAQKNCPSIREKDILRLSEVVANLEQAKSGYALVYKLSEYGPDDLDDLHKLLEDWTLDMAKVVLDEIGRRLKLVEELRARFNSEATREVQDLQPLFEKGLWILGPEFETIEYTANEGMTRVVQNLFKCNDVASRNRPDFAMLPDGTSGLYSYPDYDEDGNEVTTKRLVIVELKKPGVTIGEREKAQCWRYVKELYKKGLLQTGVAQVKCFVLGSQLDPTENSAETRNNGDVTIQPLHVTSILARAESRLLKLRERVKGAPFLQQHRDEIERFLSPVEVEAPLYEE